MKKPHQYYINCFVRRGGHGAAKKVPAWLYRLGVLNDTWVMGTLISGTRHGVMGACAPMCRTSHGVLGAVRR